MRMIKSFSPGKLLRAHKRREEMEHKDVAEEEIKRLTMIKREARKAEIKVKGYRMEEERSGSSE